MSAISPPIELLHASTDRINVIDVPLRRMLTCDGVGEPGGPAFQEATDALFSAAHAIAYCKRGPDGRHARVGPLEGLWWTGEGSPVRTADEERPGPWHWRLMIEIPGGASDAEVEASLEAIRSSRRLRPGIDRVRVVELKEGRCAQLLHTGAFGTEHMTIRRLDAGVAERGLRISGMHHEIYLGDPRRPDPEHWRSIVRYPVEPLSA